MKFELDYIEKLADLLNDKGLTEISLKEGEQAVTIKKDSPEVVTVAAPVANFSSTTVVDDTAEEPAKPVTKGKAITSPMVGTFYASPTPEAEPFVEVGSVVSPGEVVCIIEAMKLMNEIKSEHEGKITQICVKNGDPIEYGQVLMYVE